MTVANLDAKTSFTQVCDQSSELGDSLRLVWRSSVTAGSQASAYLTDICEFVLQNPIDAEVIVFTVFAVPREPRHGKLEGEGDEKEGKCGGG